MATDKAFVQHVVDQIDPACEVTSRAMFGEFGLWAKGKFIAVIGNNQLYLKPTGAGRDFVGETGEVREEPPYDGAKNYLLIEEGIEDGPWLSELIALTEAELPAPKKRKKKAKKG